MHVLSYRTAGVCDNYAARAAQPAAFAPGEIAQPSCRLGPEMAQPELRDAGGPAAPGALVRLDAKPLPDGAFCSDTARS
jgi:hypothetical protein